MKQLVLFQAIASPVSTATSHLAHLTRLTRPGFTRSHRLAKRSRVGRRKHRPRVLAVLLMQAGLLSMARAAPPLPQGGQFVQGQGSITAAGSGLTIAQTSSRGVIDWNSFSIGNGGHVNINNGSGATLNRVTGNAPSLINGLLSATGSVYLINPQGVLVGPGGVITTGGRFVASTLDADNTAFMEGGALTLSGTGNGSVINLGSISSTGGDVFLISRKAVANLGTISAPNGSAEIATGNQILLQDSSSAQQVFVQAGSNGQVLNAGAIQAAQINLQAADGNIYALAGRNTALRATGTATRDGHIWLVADGGTVNAQGTLSATNADGSGGTVDTSATNLRVTGATVDAALWNLTAPVFTIDAATARTLASNLSHDTSVAVTTTGAGGTSGDLGVLSSIRWSGAASLTLNAYHSLAIAPHASVANNGSGNLTLRADASAIDNGGSVVNNGTIDWSKSTGIVAALYDMTGTWQPGTITTNTAWSAAPFSGLVTQVTAYQLVNSMTDLNNVALNLAGNYALGTNLSPAPSTTFVAIGGGAPFTGQFDGMGHTISNLFITAASPTSTFADGNAGLFGVIGTTGVVRNLGVVDDQTTGFFSATGLLAGDNQGLITHAYSTGMVTTGEFGQGSGGGLVGQNDGTVERSWSSAQVGDQTVVGGLVGLNNGLVSQSYATGPVFVGSHGTPGGLVGENSATGVIDQSYATNQINANIVGGGLVAINAGLIEESFAASPTAFGVSPEIAYGSIAGQNVGTIANNVFWNAQTGAFFYGSSQPAPGVGIGTAISASNGLTSAQMINPASYGSSWNFGADGTWAIVAGATYPVLRWQVEP
ncbi:filamentous hemagglutinin N-terminal domain-containing protein [Paraburkholderia sp. DHOC27]|uniref:two-partner secretion domain-containing protein n=1 Tax=Paraburkholderia sp. DHOC27 TaxID=2303330 RepID=UPI000E3EB080|nr:filamentous hemagglutinin N-terminal domain-containing protein [Paraburkholderia sp. DHOC27]RFU45018.1 filamentous hemagglutinin N-terminal domain-containing protein [Paraburkholderia sp. DHOC27]